LFNTVDLLETAKLLREQSGSAHLELCLNYDQTPCDFLLHKDWIPHDRFSNFKQVVQRVEVVPGLPVLALLAGLLHFHLLGEPLAQP